MDIRELQKSVGTVKDPRRQYGNLRHKLEDILIIALCSVICQGEDFEDMELFGKERREWLGQFLELPNGIPDADTFRRVLERVNPQELSKWLREWLDKERKSGGRLVNIDGKTMRHSGNGEHRAYHVVSAWVSESGITLGELQVGEKTNEITQVPKLMDLLDIKGDVITMDAMGCQKGIAEAAVKKGADYIFALKGNQPTMEDEASAHFATADGEEILTWTSGLEKEHGRLERWTVSVAGARWFADREEWSGLKSFIRVQKTDVAREAPETSERFYISSLEKSPEEFCALIRGHWSIENQLHWCLDVIFGEDASCARKDNSPLNLNVIRKTALSMLKACNVGKRVSLKKRRYMAALSSNALSRFLGAK